MNPRPDRHSPEVLTKVADSLFPAVKEWIAAGDGLFNEEGEDEQIKRELVLAMKYSDFDGYELAKGLDGWDPDADLVDILSRAGQYVYEHHKRAVEAWVLENQVKEPFGLGTDVKVVKTSAGTVEGTILTIYPDTAEFGVHVPALGHKMTGPWNIARTILVPFENCTAIPQESATP